MLTRLVAVIVATLVTAAVIIVGGTRASAGLDVSGTWDAHYSITCNAAFDQAATELSATVNCGAGAAGTLEGSVDATAGMFSLSGLLGLIMVNLEGFIVDDDSLGGTFSALPLAEAGTFEGARVDPGSWTELSGEWVITLIDVFSSGCTAEIEQVGVDLTTSLECESLSPVTLEGTLDGNAVTLTGELTEFVDILMEATVSAEGESMEGIFRASAGSPIEITGSFAASLRGGRALTVEPTPTAGPTATPVELPDLPATGVGLEAAEQRRDIVPAMVVLTMLGVLAVAGGWYAIRRRA